MQKAVDPLLNSEKEAEKDSQKPKAKDNLIRIVIDPTKSYKEPVQTVFVGNQKEWPNQEKNANSKNESSKDIKAEQKNSEKKTKFLEESKSKSDGSLFSPDDIPEKEEVKLFSENNSEGLHFFNLILRHFTNLI